MMRGCAYLAVLVIGIAIQAGFWFWLYPSVLRALGWF